MAARGWLVLTASGAAAMSQPETNDYVQFMLKNSRTQGKILKRMGLRLRVQHSEGICWISANDMLPASPARTTSAIAQPTPNQVQKSETLGARDRKDGRAGGANSSDESDGASSPSTPHTPPPVLLSPHATPQPSSQLPLSSQHPTPLGKMGFLEQIGSNALQTPIVAGGSCSPHQSAAESNESSPGHLPRPAEANLQQERRERRAQMAILSSTTSRIGAASLHDGGRRLRLLSGIAAWRDYCADCFAMSDLLECAAVWVRAQALRRLRRRAARKAEVIGGEGADAPTSFASAAEAAAESAKRLRRAAHFWSGMQLARGVAAFWARRERMYAHARLRRRAVRHWCSVSVECHLQRLWVHAAKRRAASLRPHASLPLAFQRMHDACMQRRSVRARHRLSLVRGWRRWAQLRRDHELLGIAERHALRRLPTSRPTPRPSVSPAALTPAGEEWGAGGAGSAGPGSAGPGSASPGSVAVSAGTGSRHGAHQGARSGHVSQSVSRSDDPGPDVVTIASPVAMTSPNRSSSPLQPYVASPPTPPCEIAGGGEGGRGGLHQRASNELRGVGGGGDDGVGHGVGSFIRPLPISGLDLASGWGAGGVTAGEPFRPVSLARVVHPGRGESTDILPSRPDSPLCIAPASLLAAATMGSWPIEIVSWLQRSLHTWRMQARRRKWATSTALAYRRVLLACGTLRRWSHQARGIRLGWFAEYIGWRHCLARSVATWAHRAMLLRPVWSLSYVCFRSGLRSDLRRTLAAWQAHVRLLRPASAFSIRLNLFAWHGARDAMATWRAGARRTLSMLELLGCAYSHWQTLSLTRALRRLHAQSQELLDSRIAWLLHHQARGHFDVRQLPSAPTQPGGALAMPRAAIPSPLAPRGRARHCSGGEESDEVVEEGGVGALQEAPAMSPSTLKVQAILATVNAIAARSPAPRRSEEEALKDKFLRGASRLSQRSPSPTMRGKAAAGVGHGRGALSAAAPPAARRGNAGSENTDGNTFGRRLGAPASDAQSVAAPLRPSTRHAPKVALPSRQALLNFYSYKDR